MRSLDRLAHTNRFRHWPAADKALLTVGLLLLVLVLPPLPTAPLVLVCTMAYAVSAGIGLRPWIHLQILPLGFLLAGAVVLALPFDAAALTRAGLVSLRALAAASCLIALAATTPVAEIAAALGRLGLPAPLVALVADSYRFVFLLGAEMSAMHAAQAARLGQVTWRLRLRSAGLIAANLLPRALYRARRLEAGLAARGWTPEAVVWRPERPSSGQRRAALIAVLIVVLIAGYPK